MSTPILLSALRSPRSASVFSRRRWLQAGGLSLLGLSLPELLRASEERPGARADSCIFIVQYGGASHIDTLDPKPNAPAEMRGPYAPIATSTPGMQVSSMLPRLAQLAHRYTIVRSMSHSNSEHNGGMHVCMTGNSKPTERTPYFGSVVAKFRAAARNLPSYVWLQNLAGDVVPWYLHGGFLGATYAPLVIGKDEDNPSANNFRVRAFDPQDGAVDRLAQRTELLDRFQPPTQSLSQVERVADYRRYQENALDLVTGPQARRAFDLGEEPAQLRDRYGRHPLGQNLLLARRLIEAGVRLVTVNAWCGRASSDDVLATQGWDHHGAAVQKCGIFDTRTFGLGFVLPRFDEATSALLEDLDQRGLLASTLVIIVGEFGRSPRIATNPYPGREHWPQCYSALLAGGGIRGGATYGSSDKQGALVASHPVSPEDFGATLFHALGIDHQARFGPDGFSFRVSDGQPVYELFL